MVVQAIAFSTQVLAIGAFVACVLQQRFPLMDRSQSGWVIHKYGESILANVPPDSLLLAHTDLDWNPVRYLLHCEGVYLTRVLTLEYTI